MNDKQSEISLFSDCTPVPTKALAWLFGEEGSFEMPPQHPGGKYWWRSVFRKMIDSVAMRSYPPAMKPVSSEELIKQSYLTNCDIYARGDEPIFRLDEKSSSFHLNNYVIMPKEKWEDEKLRITKESYELAESEQPVEYTWCFKDDEEVLAHISMLWKEYACADDSKLSADAIELKKRLIAITRPERESVQLVEIADIEDHDPEGDAYAKGYTDGYKAKAIAIERESGNQLVEKAVQAIRDADNGENNIHDIARAVLTAIGVNYES